MPFKVAPVANNQCSTVQVTMGVCDLCCFIPTGPSNLLHQKRFPSRIELAIVLSKFEFDLFRHSRSRPRPPSSPIRKYARTGTDCFNCFRPGSARPVQFFFSFLYSRPLPSRHYPLDRRHRILANKFRCLPLSVDGDQPSQCMHSSRIRKPRHMKDPSPLAPALISGCIL